MKYFTWHFGPSFVVGLVGNEQEAQEEMNLANNLFNVGSEDDVFSGRINFDSPSQFYKYLIYKEWFKQPNDQKSIPNAIKVARREWAGQTRTNFMAHLKTPNPLYQLTTIA